MICLDLIWLLIFKCCNYYYYYFLSIRLSLGLYAAQG